MSVVHKQGFNVTDAFLCGESKGAGTMDNSSVTCKDCLAKMPKTPETITSGHPPDCHCAYCQALKSHVKTKEEVAEESGIDILKRSWGKEWVAQMGKGMGEGPLQSIPSMEYVPPTLQTHIFTKRVTIDETTYETTYSAQCSSPKEVEQAKDRFLKLHYSYRDGNEISALKEGATKPYNYNDPSICPKHFFEESQNDDDG